MMAAVGRSKRKSTVAKVADMSRRRMVAVAVLGRSKSMAVKGVAGTRR